MKIHREFSIMLFFLVGFIPLINAQIFIDGIGLNRSDIKFCEVLEVDYNAFKKRLSVIRETEKSLLVKTNYEMENEARQLFIDFGQTINWKSHQRFQQTDGEDIQFNGAMDALNLLVRNGWSYHTRSESHLGEVRVTRYLLERNSDYIKTEIPKNTNEESVESTMILGEKVGYIISKLENWIIPITGSQQKEITIYLDGYDEQTSPAIIEIQVSKLGMDLADFRKANQEAGYQMIDSKTGIDIYDLKLHDDNVFIRVAYILKDDDLFSFQYSTAELDIFEKYKRDFTQILTGLKDIDAWSIFDKN